MKTIFTGGENSDLTFTLKRKTFKCHQNIIKARSPVFKAMLEHDMAEKITGKINIKDADPAIFEDFLIFLYSCDKSVLNFKNITELYKLADKYYVFDLVELCVNCMVENLSKRNIFEFFELAQQHQEDILIDAAVDFFLRHRKDLVQSQNWMDFLKRNPEDANVLIKGICDLTPSC